MRGALHAAVGDAGRTAGDPGGGWPVHEIDRQPFANDIAGPVAACPRHMRRARAVARLARDVELRPRRFVPIFFRSVALAQVRRMAACAAVVPVEGGPGPVEDVAGPHVLVGVQVVPPLPAPGGGTGVPGDVERLVAAARKRDEVLLQGIHAEGVGDLVLAHRPIGTVGPHEVLAVATVEARRHPVVCEERAVEGPAHALVVGHLHGQVVMRPGPEPRLVGVASGARLAAHEGWRRLRGGAMIARRTVPVREESEPTRGGDEQRECHGRISCHLASLRPGR